MKYNKQNEKIEMITEDFLIVAIDVGSTTHYARAFDYRGIEYSKKAFSFKNTDQGFKTFKSWACAIAVQNKKKIFLVGMEPTGHYWFNLGKFVQNSGMILAHVNPAAVKKSKELDDNDPSKNDRKDPKVIAGLLKDGRYSFPYMPEGVYAKIRDISYLRDDAQKSLIRIKNRLARWLSIYFPEYKEVYGQIDAKTGMLILEEYPLPKDIVTLGVKGVIKIWKSHKARGADQRRAEKLVNAAKRSVGRTESDEIARIELKVLLKDLKEYQQRVQVYENLAFEALLEVPNAEKLLNICGVGVVSVMRFVAEVGDISRFNNAKEIQKLAGLSIKTNSSGKHEGVGKITYRGRKRLRYGMYELAISLVSRNKAFKSIHQYFTTRQNNPLKGMQSMVAISCKVIRIFFGILVNGYEFDENKMLQDIVRPEATIA